MNSWPGGKRHAMSQSAHKSWNAQHYPGTLQLCSVCGFPTDRCEEDTLDIGDGPLCEEHWREANERNNHERDED
jgi:hypothetical protein